MNGNPILPVAGPTFETNETIYGLLLVKPLLKAGGQATVEGVCQARSLVEIFQQVAARGLADKPHIVTATTVLISPFSTATRQAADHLGPPAKFG